MIDRILGILGALLLGISWIPETIRTIKTKSTGLEIRFISIYMLGSLMLLFYSIAITDPVFVGLNLFASALAIINFIYTISEIKRNSRNKSISKKNQKEKNKKIK
ncbi:MAG: hypothetical protein ACLFUO_05825 [Candidatus Woesearchaeota archaeon]